MPGSFFDTNVLIYIASSDPVRSERAETLIREGGTISVQVLNELTNVARRKMRLSWTDTHALLSIIRGLLLVCPITTEIHKIGLRLAERYALSVFDAMIVAAALDAGCELLWSEDMQDGLTIENRLRIANPFGR
jgi:predicted nucleic acid-binding protein